MRVGAAYPIKTRRGLCGTPLTRYSKCRCGPVVQPVSPTNPIRLTTTDKLSGRHRRRPIQVIEVRVQRFLCIAVGDHHDHPVGGTPVARHDQAGRQHDAVVGCGDRTPHGRGDINPDVRALAERAAAEFRGDESKHRPDVRSRGRGALLLRDLASEFSQLRLLLLDAAASLEFRQLALADISQQRDAPGDHGGLAFERRALVL